MVGEGTKLYRLLVKDYFVSRMFTEEQAIMISKQPHYLLGKFIKLEKVKIQEELVIAIRDNIIPIKET